jgi:hypothetical protein
MTEYVYVPYNSQPEKGKPYFAIGGVHWSASGSRNFMGDAREWRKRRKMGWKIIKCKLTAMPRAHDYSHHR